MSDTKSYWWSRYGDFAPGVGMYPHMGQVITYYRLKRGFRTQQDLAIALGVSKRTVEELEGSMNLDTPDSIERRQIIAQLLRIPPALLALDWRFMVYEKNSSDQRDTFADIAQLLEDDTFLRLNATALHHEKAKTLIQFGRFREAHSEIITARKTLLADLLTWHINLHLTEANLYKAQKDLEGCAASAIEAYKIAKVVQSPKDEIEVKQLFLDLKSIDASNPYVCNLGMTIGSY